MHGEVRQLDQPHRSLRARIIVLVVVFSPASAMARNIVKWKQTRGRGDGSSVNMRHARLNDPDFSVENFRGKRASSLIRA